MKEGLEVLTHDTVRFILDHFSICLQVWGNGVAVHLFIIHFALLFNFQHPYIQTNAIYFPSSQEYSRKDSAES